MEIHETKVRRITLDASDIKQAIIMYLKAREESVEVAQIELHPDNPNAVITITQEVTPKAQKAINAL